MPRTTRADTIEALDNETAHLIGILRHIAVLELLVDDEDEVLIQEMLRVAAKLKARIIARRQRWRR